MLVRSAGIAAAAIGGLAAAAWWPRWGSNGRVHASSGPHRANSLIAQPVKTTARTVRPITGGSQTSASRLSMNSLLRQRSSRQWKYSHLRPRGARAATVRYLPTCQRAKRRRLRISTISAAAQARPPARYPTAAGTSAATAQSCLARRRGARSAAGPRAGGAAEAHAHALRAGVGPMLVEARRH